MRQSEHDVQVIIDENVTRIDDMPDDKAECCVFGRFFMKEDMCRGFVCWSCIVAEQE